MEEGLEMNTKGRVLASCALAGVLVSAIALPAAAWHYRYLGYPGVGPHASTTLSEGSCTAKAEAWQNSNSVAITTRTSQPLTCYVSAQLGYWAGDHVDWYGRDIQKLTASIVYGTSYYYESEHGVDS